MDIDSTITLDDAIFWANLIAKHLDEALELAKKLDEELDVSTMETHSPFRLRTKLQGIKARNEHVLFDLDRLKTLSAPTTS